MNTTTFASAARAIAGAARAALAWRLLLAWSVLLLLPTIVAALPMWSFLGAALDHSPHAARLAQALDLMTVTDLAEGARRQGTALTLALMASIAITLLLSPLLSGMAITAARAPGAAPLGQLLAGGLRAYPRMGRMLVWGALLLGLALMLGDAGSGAAARFGEQAVLAADADRASVLATLLLALLLMLVQASLDAGRAQLALDSRRSSAIKAWWLGCRLLARRPLACGGAYLAIGATGLLLAGALALVRIRLVGADASGFAAAFALTQLVALVLAWMRCARLFAFVALARTA